MDQGKILREGTKEKLLEEVQGEKVIVFRKNTLDDLFVSLTGRKINE
jgi:hypothetical protein